MTKINIYHGDSLSAMESMEDKKYGLAICDPPYFSGPEKRGYYGNKTGKSKHSKTGIGQRVKRVQYPISTKWERPTADYFNLIQDISNDQIIWGINYFINKSYAPGRIVWDKVNHDSSFSDSEIALCTLHHTVRNFTYMWNGMMQGKSISEGNIQQGDKTKNEKRIHTTQKPVILYKWLLKKYGFNKDGSKRTIFDSHGGSLSIVIACIDLGFDIDIWELDPDYYRTAVNRVKKHLSQLDLTREPVEINYL